MYFWLAKISMGRSLENGNYLTNRIPSKAVTLIPFETWKNRKPSIQHIHVWGCRAEARPYNPKESKLDSKTVSCFFIGYPDHSRGYKFYSPSYTSRIIETNRAMFFDEVSHSHSLEDLELEFSEIPEASELESARTDQPISLEPITAPVVNDVVVSVHNDHTDHNVKVNDPKPVVEPHDAPESEIIELLEADNAAPAEALRRSTRERKSALPEDYIVYLQEADFDIGEVSDPVTFNQAINSDQSQNWEAAMVAELESMKVNDVWTLVQLPKSHKAIGCKWVFKTKMCADGNIERYKARLVAKGFTQQEGVDFNETFSPVSTKDAFRVIMALVAHYDMELHQMDVKTAFLNGELEEEIYMKQPEGFIEPGTEHMVCRLNKSIYGLKQASRQWYLKFDSVVSEFGFVENQVDECVYMKSEGKNFIFLVLYVDDILLASSDVNLLKRTKCFLSQRFDMKDLGEASYVLGIEIKRDKPKNLLGLCQQAYINKVLKRFDMQNCTGGLVPMAKGDRLHKGQCPKNDLERENMKSKPYAQLVGSLMYAQVCTRPDLAYAVGILSRFQSNPGYEHWIGGKKVLRYLQKTKNHLLVYRRVKELEVVGYTDADFASHYPNSGKSTSGYVFMLAGGAIAWKSVKQTLTTTSTMQAEFIAIYEGVCEGLWLKNFLIQTNVVDTIVSRPLKIYCDNSAAVCFTKNNKRSTNSKHIDLKYYTVRERVKNKELEVLKIATLAQLADPFTKALTVAAFTQHANDMGILPSLDA